MRPRLPRRDRPDGGPKAELDDEDDADNWDNEFAEDPRDVDAGEDVVVYAAARPSRWIVTAASVCAPRPAT